MERKERITLYVIISLLLLIIGIFSFVNHRQKEKLTVSEQNVKALTDTLHSVKLKNGELITYRDVLIIEKKTLETYLGIKKSELSDMERKLNANVLLVSKLKSEVRVDTIIMKAKKECFGNDGYCRYDFEENTKWYRIAGHADIDSSDNATVTITENVMDIDLKVGMDEEWKIFASTDNPYVKISDMKGALLDKDLYLKREKKKRWGVGVQVGIGGQYGIIHRQFDVGPYVGIGISYNFVVF